MRQHGFPDARGLYGLTPAAPARSRCRLLADFVAEVANARSKVRGWNSSASLILPLVPLGASVLGGGLRLPSNSDPTQRLPGAHGGNGRRLCGELGQPTQVLGDCCQGELVLCATRPTQPQTTELQDAF